MRVIFKRHVSTEGTLELGHKSTQSTLALEYVITEDTLARKHARHVAREPVGKQGK